MSDTILLAPETRAAPDRAARAELRRKVARLEADLPPGPGRDTGHGARVLSLEDLERIRDDYGNPPVYITENGTGFGESDERFERGLVIDPLRADYISRHVEAALAARAAGADLRGYMVWSLFDNFEWMQGYDRRFGIVHVDFETQKRTRKQSFETYREIIAKGV